MADVRIDTLFFDDALVRILNYNSTIRNQYHHIQEANSELQYIQKTYYPVFSFGSTLGAAKFSNAIPMGQGYLLPYDEFNYKTNVIGSVGLLAESILYDGQRKKYNIQIGRLNINKSKLENKIIENEQLFQLVKLFVSACMFDQKMKNIKHQIALLNNTYEKLMKIKKLDLVYDNEVDEIRQYTEEKEFNYQEVQFEYENLMMQLCIELDVDSIGTIVSYPFHQFFKNTIQENQIGGLIDNCCDLQEYKIDIEIAYTKLQLGKNQNDLTISWNGSIRYGGGMGWYCGVGLNWTFIDFGRNDALTTKTMQKYLMAQESLKYKEKIYNKEIRSLYHRIQLLMKKSEMIKKKITSQRSIIESLKSKPNNSYTDLLTYTQNEIQLQDILLSEIDISMALQIAWMRYFCQTGYLKELLINGIK